MIKPIHTYGSATQSVVICLVSVAALLVGAIGSKIGKGSFTLDSAPSIINALVFPYVMLVIWGGSDPGVERKRATVTFVSTMFSVFLLVLAGSIYWLGFPASKNLANLPVITVLFFMPVMLWLNRKR